MGGPLESSQANDRMILQDELTGMAVSGGDGQALIVIDIEFNFKARLATRGRLLSHQKGRVLFVHPEQAAGTQGHGE